MGRGIVDSAIVVRAPLAQVFDRISDHEAMSTWAGARCRLIRDGTPRNGVGAIRRIVVFGLTLDEEIVQFEPPRRYDYSIIRGLPVIHRGTVRLRDHKGGTHVHWHVELTSEVPLLAQAVAAALRLGLTPALRKFARMTARSHQGL